MGHGNNDDPKNYETPKHGKFHHSPVPNVDDIHQNMPQHVVSSKQLTVTQWI